MAGVPVDASVAAILRPTWPLLPMPMTTTRPRTPSIRSHRPGKALAGAGLQAQHRGCFDVEGFLRQAQRLGGVEGLSWSLPRGHRARFYRGQPRAFPW